MSSFSKRRFTLRHPVVVDIGCSCRRSKLSSLFSSSSTTNTTSTNSSKPPKPNPGTPPKHQHPLSSYYPFSPSTTTFSTTTNLTTTSASSPSPPSFKYKPLNRPRVAKESVAVVKESQDPYNDFKDSMLQMILEKEIYAFDDLRDLLRRFLSLNSPYHHDSILRAFSEIWNDIFSSSTSSSSSSHISAQRRKHRRRRQSRDCHV